METLVSEITQRLNDSRHLPAVTKLSPGHLLYYDKLVYVMMYKLIKFYYLCIPGFVTRCQVVLLSYVLVDPKSIEDLGSVKSENSIREEDVLCQIEKNWHRWWVGNKILRYDLSNIFTHKCSVEKSLLWYIRAAGSSSLRSCLSP